MTHIKQKMREKIKGNWTLFLNEQGEDPKLKEICPDIKGTPINIGLSRKDTMKLVRLRIGHTRVTHSYYLTGDEIPWCVECETPMSVKHILLEHRSELSFSAFLSFLNFSTSFYVLLAFLRPSLTNFKTPQK